MTCRCGFYFKPRRKQKTRRCSPIAISAREDGEGRIRAWGLLDPATGQFLRTGPNHIDPADIHLSMTMSDREGFLWNDRWLKKVGDTQPAPMTEYIIEDERAS